MAYAREHPFPGQPHPWTDTLAPVDFLSARPDWALQAAGAFAPRPEDFPFTDIGKGEYYAAVEQAAHRQMAMQHQHMAGMHAQAEGDARSTRERAERDQDDDDLLLTL